MAWWWPCHLCASVLLCSQQMLSIAWNDFMQPSLSLYTLHHLRNGGGMVASYCLVSPLSRTQRLLHTMNMLA